MRSIAHEDSHAYSSSDTDMDFCTYSRSNPAQQYVVLVMKMQSTEVKLKHTYVVVSMTVPWPAIGQSLGLHLCSARPEHSP